MSKETVEQKLQPLHKWAFELGQRDFTRGMPVSANPYKTHTTNERYAWSRGWESAHDGALDAWVEECRRDRP